jgi:hypothetical protein
VNDSNWKATNHQTNILKVVDGKNPEAPRLTSFCLSPEGNILTALRGTEREVHLLSPDGEQLGGWTIPVQPEAINVGPENTIIVAGQGRILVLDSDGEILKQADAPHTAMLGQNLDSIRHELKQRRLQTVKAMERQVEYFKESA